MRLKKEEFVYFLTVRCHRDTRMAGAGGNEVFVSLRLAQCAFRVAR